MIDVENDLKRELAKAREALEASRAHLAAHAEANAALHVAANVMYSPLHAKVVAAIAGIDHALARHNDAQPDEEGRPLPTLDHRTRLGALAAILADLDRCIHGRHEGDTCAECGGPSKGNPNFRTGQVIGYGLYADQIVMPPRERRSEPRAWRPKYQPAAEASEPVPADS